jgi:hypothetical protein
MISPSWHIHKCVCGDQKAGVFDLRRSQRLMNGSRSISGAQLTKQNTMHAARAASAADAAAAAA